jgi:hypothetical protein
MVKIRGPKALRAKCVCSLLAIREHIAHMGRFARPDGIPGKRSSLAFCALTLGACLLVAQEAQKPAPMPTQQLQSFQTSEFTVKLVRSSQTLASLQPKSVQGFDFEPADRLADRFGNGYYQLGDLDLVLRTGMHGSWKNYSTALAREPVKPLPATGNIFAAADLAPTLAPDIPLAITRNWSVDESALVLRFTLRNKTAQTVEVGGLGMPMVFDNIITGRSLADAHETCSFFDPYIGEDAGYLQVTRLNGHGPALLVVPYGHTPFEAYKPILNPETKHGVKPAPEIFAGLTPRSMTFEGFYDWMVASKALQETDWKAAKPWNAPSSITLRPGESRTVGVRFLLSPTIPAIEQTLAVNNRPVAVGIPGYILPMDIHAKLFLNYAAKVRSITVEPADAIAGRMLSAVGGAKHDQQEYALDGKAWGRARLSITYDDGLLQTINYFVIKPEAAAVADLGNFLATKQWFVDPKDPFHRSFSPMTYDREANRIVTQDNRVWIAGLSDEGGAGPYLAMAMKELGEPNKAEIAKFETFVDGVLWGQLQPASGPEKDGVRKSLFYYAPAQFPNYYDPRLNWTTWASWNEHDAYAVDRSYDYPHAVTAYWAMYRLARYHTGLVTDHGWQWYLQHAYDTTMAMPRLAPYYTQYGQMEGDVFLFVLQDLQREGMTADADALEAMLRARAVHWKDEAYPFGSEMPWDSTGQEEVYALTKYFGDHAKAEQTVNAVLGYDPAIPSWGYNGSARRYWDFLYGGKYRRLERQLHHYGSGINATPLLSEYRDHPDDLYLLRVGYGGTMGELSNIDQQGFGSAAFHSFPDKMAFDPLSGDYGSGFFGHAINTATYLTNDAELGWLAFGGNVEIEKNAVTVTTLDSFRHRLYLAPLGLWLTLDAGKFEQARIDVKTRRVLLRFAPASTDTPQAYLRMDQPATIEGVGKYAPLWHLDIVRGAYVVPLGKHAVEVTLQAGPVAKAAKAGGAQ